ncbi:YicC family protein [Wandonia haliotis]|uniref:YicC family protein n=1 Tax=Wandonia haliotis TaxID=574963 RepID=A0ABN1MKX2_9FLAO
MLHSMTGFGKASGTYLQKKITIEIRSLNSKSLDLNVRLIPLYKEKEIELRKQVGACLERGKVEVTIAVENNGEERSSVINKAVARAYFNDIKDLEQELGVKSPDPISQLLRMSDIFVNTREELDPEEWTFVSELVDEALHQMEDFRMQEGKSLQADFSERIAEIRALLGEVQQYEEERIITIKERMQKALDEKLGEALDQNRLEQEFIMYIEKLDVSEEKVRLANHLNYFEETMASGKGAGKKLGFISQEIGREINTLGSKSNHVEMQKLVVQMKDNLEKIKEQVLNTL